MRIAVFAHGGLGNWIMATPMLRALETLGHSVSLYVDETQEGKLIRQISWLPIKDAANLLSGNELAECFDCGFSFQHPGRIPGQLRKLFHEFSGWKEFPLTQWDLDSSHEVEYFMQAARMLGYQGPPPKPFVRKDELLYEYIKPEDIPQHIGIALGSHLGWDWYKKMWPVQSWIALIELLQRRGFPIMLYGGGEADEWQMDEIKQHVPVRCILNSPLQTVASILGRHCQLLIGNDTGIAHLAAAVDVPTVTLFGPTLINKNLPVGTAPSYILKTHLACAPCYGTDLWSQCTGGCMPKLHPSHVFEFVRQYCVKSILCPESSR